MNCVVVYLRLCSWEPRCTKGRLCRKRPFFEEKAVVRAFHAVHSCCDGQRNPGVVTLHDGSFDPWGVGPELRGALVSPGLL